MIHPLTLLLSLFLGTAPTGAPAQGAASGARPAPGARARIEIAKNLYRVGKGFFRHKNYREALTAFTRSHSLSGRPELLYNIALCHEHLGKAQRAISTLVKYLRHFPREKARIVARIKVLRARIRSTALVIQGGILGAQVYINGERRGTLPLKHQHVPPGPVRVEVRSGNLRFSKALTLLAGETATLTVTLVGKGPSRKSSIIILRRRMATVEPRPARPSKLLPRLLLGAGAVLLAGGGALGYMALKRVDSAEDARLAGDVELSSTYETQARRFGYATDGVFVLSLAGIVAGTILYFMEE